MQTTTPQKPQTPIWAKQDQDRFNQEKEQTVTKDGWSTNPWEVPAYAPKAVEIKVETPKFSSTGSLDININTADQRRMAEFTLKSAAGTFSKTAEIGKTVIGSVINKDTGKAAVEGLAEVFSIISGIGYKPEAPIDQKAAMEKRQKESNMRQNVMAQEADRARMENMRVKKAMEDDQRLGVMGGQEQKAAASGNTNTSFQESNNIYSKMLMLMKNSWKAAKQKAASAIKPPTSKKAAGGGANFKGQEAYDKAAGGTVYSAGG